jgi:hypothetical protein
MSKKLGPIQQWMADHPNDTPYPGGGAGQHWRRARGLDDWYNVTKARRAEEKKRQQEMAEKPTRK